MSDVGIRAAQWCDAPYLYRICLQTADSGGDATALYDDPFVVGQYYAAPYLFFDRTLCFIAESDGVPAGYIVAAADTTAFNSWMESVWLPPLRRNYRHDGKRPALEARLIEKIHERLGVASRPCVCEYPAHLHIDLLPQVQGGGWGSRLMATLLDELARRGVQGVHLGVDERNTRAIAFYRRQGFSLLQDGQYGLLLGKK